MKMITWGLFVLVSIIVILILWASYPWSLGESVLKSEIIHLEPEEMVNNEEFPAVIKILTWNLGYLYGKGSEGPGYNFKEKDFFEERQKKLIQEIKEWEPDIICLQEVDFESSRTHDLNQARILAIKAGYPYVAEAISWEANYIPFPYWPIQNNFGRMKSGGAILSKYPLSNHENVLFAKPRSQPWWYNLFYLHRYIQKVTVDFGDKKISIINLHLEAFDKVDRKTQIDKLVTEITTHKIDIVAGDFNMLPSVASKRSRFFNDDDYENDLSYEGMLKANLGEVVPNDIYIQDESRFFTFPSWKPDRRLDYIWYQTGLKMMKAEVLPSALSDHLPIKASFQISSPKFNLYSQ